MIEIATITDEEGLARLRPEWEELWRRDPAATPFQSPAWLLAWWRFFGTSEPLILTARAGGQLVGLLPLYLLRENGCRKLLPIGVGLSDYIELLRSPEAPEVGDMFIAAIAAMPEWDECWLPDLAPEGALAGTVGHCGLAEVAMPAPPCPVLEIAVRSVEARRDRAAQNASRSAAGAKARRIGRHGCDRGDRRDDARRRNG